jgi:septal ring factor EnvC (AmiA/AmiB activator)
MGGIHAGMDFAVPAGKTVRAITSGRVIAARRMGGEREAVVVRMGNGREVLYGNMNRIDAVAGHRMHPGSRLGTVDLSETSRVHIYIPK